MGTHSRGTVDLPATARVAYTCLTFGDLVVWNATHCASGERRAWWRFHVGWAVSSACSAVETSYKVSREGCPLPRTTCLQSDDQSAGMPQSAQTGEGAQ